MTPAPRARRTLPIAAPALFNIATRFTLATRSTRDTRFTLATRSTRTIRATHFTLANPSSISTLATLAARGPPPEKGLPMIRKLAIVVTVTATLAACGSNAAGSSSTSSGTGADKKVKVTFIQGVAGDPFYETMACGAKAEATKDNVDLTVQGAKNWDVSLQIPLLNSVIATRPGALFIAPNDSNALIQPLKQATSAGIKIVLVDTTLADTSFVSSAIASDNLKGGETAADALAKLVGEKGSVLLVGGQPGVSTAEARQKGFEDGLKKYPSIKYVGNVFTSNGVAKISQLVSAQLAAHPDLAGIFALSTDQSEGANNAVKAASKAGQVKLVGFDAGPAQVEQLRNGVVQALVAQQPAQIGSDGVDQAAAAARGQSVTKEIGTDSTVITKDNVDQPDVAKYLYKTTCS